MDPLSETERMAAQSLSQQPSGISPSDYEVSEQQVQEPQGQSEPGDGRVGENGGQDLSSDLASRLHEELNPISGQPELEPESRRSSSQEQNAESQYSPISLAPVNGQMCSNCRTTSTPLWRRSPTGSTICNACGLYYKARNTSRPTNLKRPPSTSASRPSSDVDTGDYQRSLSPSAIDNATQAGRATYVAASQVPSGTCPGEGRCNGTGGASGCNGCPAYNNRVSKTTQVSITHLPPRSEDNGQTQTTGPSHEETSPRSAAQEIPQQMAHNTTNLVLS
ncbi:MAG: hypothetical protein Q9195_001494, partial [Heterodermia aff. obscurata]